MLWARADVDNGGIILWLPNPEAFARLVAAGDLPGLVLDRGSDRAPDVRLDALDEAQLAVIAGDRKRELFDWEHPLVLLRLPRR
jgi:hypothetical protein